MGFGPEIREDDPQAGLIEGCCGPSDRDWSVGRMDSTVLDGDLNDRIVESERPVALGLAYFLCCS